jgi:hypothetical protein
MFIHLAYLFFFFVCLVCVLGPWEFLWRAGSYIFCVGLRCVECRVGTILFGPYPGVGGGTVQIFFLSPGSAVAGTVRLNW